MDFISTHTPLAGRDQFLLSSCPIIQNFYSHAPCGARLLGGIHLTVCPCISTHTPLAGRDDNVTDTPSLLNDFYSHAPCGARPDNPLPESCTILFLLTRPLRGATTNTGDYSAAEVISTHTPLAGRDTAMVSFGKAWLNFYSHAPCGARRRTPFFRR